MPKVVTDNESVFLEICIPTYNRSKQLDRLLTILESEIRTALIDATIRITISDNCSSDDTQVMLQSHSFRDKVVVRTNPENIGALRNIWGLYETVRAEYVWIISDDDIPKPGSIQKVLDTLIGYKPDVLTFEFEQPPGSYKRWHGNKSGIEEITDLREAIPNILALGKLSKYVINARHLKNALVNVSYLRDTGYGWLAVILETISLSTSKKIVINHDFLASCDDKYTELFEELTPQFWDDYLFLLDQEIVKSNCPEYAKRYRYRHHSYMVLMIYGVMAGFTKASNNQTFQEYGKKLPFHISYIRNPLVYFQWVFLRLGIPASPILCRMIEYQRKIRNSQKCYLNKANEMYTALKDRAKRSDTIYKTYMFVQNRIRFKDWMRKGRPVPPPHIVKQHCVLTYRKHFGLDVLIETGTYRGEMVRAVSSAFKEIYSIELSYELYQNAKRLFASLPHIHVLHGDSSKVLPDLLEHIRQPCLFWLDAHYSGKETALADRDTPIMSELSCILSHAVNQHVILIDDTRCFNGQSDYPSLDELREYVLKYHPEWIFRVQDDIIRIHPPE